MLTSISTHSAQRFSPSGEALMPLAPQVILSNGRWCVPQHYRRYQHTPESIAHILAQIRFDESTPLFAGSDHGGMYLQVGMIGRENYDRSNTQRPHKLVYGRKWRIDADTPTSEIIQTAFLAIKKAREHEVRELLTLRDGSGKTSAPFSNHQDLLLMADIADLVLSAAPQAEDSIETLQAFLCTLHFGQRPIELLAIERRKNGSDLLDLRLGEPPLARQLEGDLPEFNRLELTLVLKQRNTRQLAYALMDALIAHSDQFVEEHFQYRAYRRFSRANDPAQIAQLSLQTRPYARDLAKEAFSSVFKAANYEVDASRAPELGRGELGDYNRGLIDAFPGITGHLPKGYAAHQTAELAA